MNPDVETRAALQAFLDEVVEKAKQNLGATRKRKNFRATWSNGEMQSFTVSFSQRNSVNTGALQDSIKGKTYIRSGKLFGSIDALEYGIYVNRGRLPGKGVPIEIMRAWVKSPKFKIQKLQRDKEKQPDGTTKRTGPLRSLGFAPKTDQNVNAVAFLVNRKIRTFGIEKTEFVDQAVEQILPKHINLFARGYARDIANRIRKKYGI